MKDDGLTAGEARSLEREIDRLNAEIASLQQRLTHEAAQAQRVLSEALANAHANGEALEEARREVARLADLKNRLILPADASRSALTAERAREVAKDVAIGLNARWSIGLGQMVIEDLTCRIERGICAAADEVGEGRTEAFDWAMGGPHDPASGEECRACSRAYGGRRECTIRAKLGHSAPLTIRVAFRDGTHRDLPGNTPARPPFCEHITEDLPTLASMAANRGDGPIYVQVGDDWREARIETWRKRPFDSAPSLPVCGRASRRRSRRQRRGPS